jgi:hypothetical protein
LRKYVPHPGGCITLFSSSPDSFPPRPSARSLPSNCEGVRRSFRISLWGENSSSHNPLSISVFNRRNMANQSWKCQSILGI